jgi:hypothetical protein
MRHLAQESQMLSKLSRIKLGGTLASIIIALIAWLVTRDALSSLIVGLVAELFAFVIDLDQELESVRTSISKALELRERLAKNQEILSDVFRLGGDYADVLDSANPLFVAQAQELMTETLHQMSCLSDGYMEVAPSPSTRGVRILNNLQVGGFATSIVGRGSFWKSESGQTYHQANLQAARRGCKVMRVFLFKSKEVLGDDEFRKIVEEQIRAGIEIRALWIKDVTPNLRVDFALWDDKLLIEQRIVPDTTEVPCELLDSRHGALAKARQLRDQLRAKSMPIKNLADLDKFLESLNTKATDAA